MAVSFGHFRVVFCSPCFSRCRACRVRLSLRWHPLSRVVVKPYPGAFGGNNRTSNGNFLGSCSGFLTRRTHGSRVALLVSGLSALWRPRPRLSRLTSPTNPSTQKLWRARASERAWMGWARTFCPSRCLAVVPICNTVVHQC